VRAFFRLTGGGAHVAAEVWSRDGWKPYDPAPLDWSNVEFDEPFDQGKIVKGDLVIYVNKGWRSEAMGIGLFENSIPSAVIISRMARVLPGMIEGLAHKLSIPLTEGGILNDIEVSDLRGFSDGSLLSDDIFDQLDRHNASLNAILSELREVSGASQVRVFGSAAKGKQVPGDLDLYVDLNGLEPDVEKALTGALMSLARKHYGLVDPFLDKKGVLYTRNDSATGWEKAKQAGKISGDGRAGITIDHVCIVDRPYASMRSQGPSVEQGPSF
jgi:predicted nucleotidyltransferase